MKNTERQVVVLFQDITERKKQEEALRKSEEKYRWLFETMDLGFAIVEPIYNESSKLKDYRYLELNPSFIKLTGISESFVGKTVLDIIPDLDPFWIQTYQKLLDTRQSTRFVQHVPQLGRWFDISAFYYGGLIGIYYEDVTERKKTEEALRESEEKYRTLFNTMEEALSVVEVVRDDTGQVIDLTYLAFNPANDRQTGLDGQAMIGRKLSELATKSDLERFIAIYARVANTGEAANFEEYVKFVDRWYAASVYPQGEELFIFYRDITESKHQEQRQKFLLNLSDKLGVADSLKDVQTTVTNSLHEHYDAGWCYYVEWDEEKNSSFVRYDSKRDDLVSLAGTHDVSDIPEFLDLLKSKQIINVRNYEDYELLSPKIRERYTAIGFRSMLVASLVRQGRLISSLIIGDTKIRNWSSYDEALLTEVAERTWAAVERAKVEEALRTSEERQTFLLKLNDALRPLSDPTEIQHVAMQVLGQQLGVNRAQYYLADETGEYLSSSGGYTNGVSAAIGRFRLIEFGQYAYDGFHAGETQVVSDATIDPRISEAVLRSYKEVGFLAYIGVPFVQRGRLIGTVAVHQSGPRQWTDNERILVEETTERAGIAVERARVEEALRKSELKYRLLFESIDQGFCIIEMIFDSRGHGYDYRFIETNPSFENQTGLKDVIGKTMRELVPQQEQHWFDIYGNVAREQKPIRFIQQALHLDNRWYEVYAYPTGDADQHRVAILFFDITRRKRAELEMKKLNSELQELDKLKTTFFSNISHEFRTPITLLLGPLDDVIKGNASLLPKQQIDKLVMAQRNALRLQKLVNSLLDFSRFEAGQAHAIFQPTDIIRFTTNLAGIFRSAIEDAGLKFVIKSDEVDEPVYLNHDLYEKIVLNLLSNAFKFTQKGKIEVKIRNKKKKIELHVIDTGVGIAAQHHKKIFERFNRIEGTKSRTFEGSGIGLALVKEMVTVHGATISVKSTPDKGSEFIISFPKGKDHLSPEKVYESRDQLTASNAQPYLEEIKGWLYEPEVIRKPESFTTKPVVLLADDNADMRAYLSVILQPRYQLMKVENGKKAWAMIKSGFAPDVVLADVMMPEMNGLELLEYIKRTEKTQRIPVILISARADEASRIEGMNSGADDYLIKPFAARELIARVDARIQIARLRYQAEGQLAVTNELLESVVRERTRELKATNETLVRKNHELEALYNELTQLTFVTSHDLREPLRKLSVFTEVINNTERNSLSSGGKEYLSKIISFVQRMNNLLNDINIYSALSDEQPHVVHNSMIQLVQSARASLKKIIADQHIMIETDLYDAIECDPKQIKQLICHLLTNAIKFRKPEHTLHIHIIGKRIPGIKLDHRLADTNKIYYRLEVKDNGIGFEQRYEDRIFNMFRKLHNPIDYPGTGIGLTICKKIVENHQGFIVARSSPGEGSSFCMFIPQQNS